MALTYYRYDDASAPTLTGQVGSFVALLDACLVTGYGSKAAAGWTKPYTGTNKAVFRMASGAGKNGHYLRILDDGTSPDGGARTAAALGFATMTTVDAGTGQFPDASQIAANFQGLYITKSNTLDTVQRPWFIVADDTYFFFYCWHLTTDWSINSALAKRQTTFSFGQFDSVKPGDTWNTLINGRNNASYSDTGLYRESYRLILSGAHTANSRLFFARDHLAYRDSAAAAWTSGGIHSSQLTTGVGDAAFPNSITGDIDYSPVIMTERDLFSPTNSSIMRGNMPLFRCFDGAVPDITLSPQPAFIRMFDIITGIGVDAGKTFIVIPLFYNGAGYAHMIQISGSRTI